MLRICQTLGRAHDFVPRSKPFLDRRDYDKRHQPEQNRRDNNRHEYANRRERINVIAKYMDYRLELVSGDREVPKDALNIAHMLGISDEIIEGAKRYLK